jgi:hypothetical protein
MYVICLASWPSGCQPWVLAPAGGISAKIPCCFENHAMHFVDIILCGFLPCHWIYLLPITADLFRILILREPLFDVWMGTDRLSNDRALDISINTCRLGPPGGHNIYMGAIIVWSNPFDCGRILHVSMFTVHFSLSHFCGTDWILETLMLVGREPTHSRTDIQTINVAKILTLASSESGCIGKSSCNT